MIGSKKCYGCKEEKVLELFGRHNNTKDGRQHYCLECAKECRKANREKNIEYQRKRRKLNVATAQNYGITLDEYERMEAAQDYRCYICEKHRDDTYRGKLYLDHCHKTNTIRKFLCQHCNTMLGFAGDDTKILRKALSYLLEHKTEGET